MFEFYEKFKGFIPLLGGIYGLLMTCGVLPRNPKDPEKMELWRRKFGTLMKVACPVMILYGILELAGVV